MKRYLLAIIWLTINNFTLVCQHIQIGLSAPLEPSAILQVEHIGKGLQLPRIGDIQNDLIPGPGANGLIAFDQNDLTIQVYNENSITWQSLSVPSGIITMWTGGAPPEGWALCDGQNNTPDLRARFIVGYDGGSTDYNTLNVTGGQDFVTLSESQLPNHGHALIDPGHVHTGSVSHTHTYLRRILDLNNVTNNAVNVDLGGGSNSSNQSENTASVETTFDIVTSSEASVQSVSFSGNSQPHENRPPYYILAFIIKL
jgi:microcystin-dependent protein